MCMVSVFVLPIVEAQCDCEDPTCMRYGSCCATGYICPGPGETCDDVCNANPSQCAGCYGGAHIRKPGKRAIDWLPKKKV